MLLSASRHICMRRPAHEGEEHGGELELGRQLLRREDGVRHDLARFGHQLHPQAGEAVRVLLEVRLADGQLRRPGFEDDGVARPRVGHGRGRCDQDVDLAVRAPTRTRRCASASACPCGPRPAPARTACRRSCRGRRSPPGARGAGRCACRRGRRTCSARRGCPPGASCTRPGGRRAAGAAGRTSPRSSRGSAGSGGSPSGSPPPGRRRTRAHRWPGAPRRGPPSGPAPRRRTLHPTGRLAFR